jgi:thioredoxin-dependent peroxiredoxin
VARGIQAGDKAPDFTLPSQSGDQVRLQDRLGERVIVLYFYPKDNTPGCTAEACAFRDSHETFTDAGAEVIGISSDSADRHAGFASKHRLPFTLLADQGGRVRKAYGVPAVMGLIPGRVTYVIDRTGTVRHVFNSMTNIDGHVGEALEVVRQLQAEQPALPGRLRAVGQYLAAARTRGSSRPSSAPKYRPSFRSGRPEAWVERRGATSTTRPGRSAPVLPRR